jgi:hypothetical protein
MIENLRSSLKVGKEFEIFFVDAVRPPGLKLWVLVKVVRVSVRNYLRNYRRLEIKQEYLTAFPWHLPVNNN